MRSGAIVGLLAIAGAAQGCTAAPGPSNDDAILGTWGGRHAGLALTESGGTIEYDCAHGGLASPIRPDRAGRFEVGGVHVREHGGPIRVDEPVDSIPARYIGRITGDRMTLRVIAGPDTLGPFELTRGATPQVLKCL